MLYSLLADLIVAIHVAYVAFVVLGLPLIWLGVALGWHWVLNRWFRGLHLLAIIIVACESVLSIACPLTEWEAELRRQAGLPVEEGTFVGRLLHALIFFQAPEWVFTIIYVAFAGVVLATMFLAPPRRSRARDSAAAHEIRNTMQASS